MQSRLLDRIAKPFNVEMPEHQTLDDLLDNILPQIRQHSEDLNEQRFYLGKHWIDVRDDEDFHDIIMHIFNDEGEHVNVKDGEMECGGWRLMGGNKIMFGDSTCEGVVYNLAFLDDDFFVLHRHGNTRKFEHKYLFLVREPIATRMVWHEAVEYLYDKYRNSNSFFVTVAIIMMLIVAIIMLLS